MENNSSQHLQTFPTPLSQAITPNNYTNAFSPMLNGAATNQLTNISTRSHPPIVDTITGNATIEKGTLRVFIDSYSELTGGLRTSTHKLLDACTMVLTQQNPYRAPDNAINPTVIIPLDRYMEMCGIPQTKSSKDYTRKKVKEDLETLYHISMEWTEQSGKKTKDFAKTRVCDKIALSRGNIVFSFSRDMARYLTNAYVMQYPTELLKVDERNPSSYHVGKKLLLHNSIDNNRRKGTANVLSVKALLDVCPDIPTYEQVQASDRAFDRRIVKPFETALNSLPFITWEYCNSKGAPLTDEQLTAMDYDTFSKMYILFVVEGAPDQTARLEAKAARAANAKAKAAPRKRKAAGSEG